MLTLHSPAKVNLFLRVLRKRSDGYHEIASLFQAIDLFDKIHFRIAEKDIFTCSDPTLPTDGNNLVIKALNLFKRKTQTQKNFKIHLEKKIPMQAGLGGGSSNAATTLWALNQLCGQPLAIEELWQWAAEIGSDVAFFLSSGTAYCTGRGEIMQHVPPLLAAHLTIIKPKDGLPTPEVYRAMKLSQLPLRDPGESLQQFVSGKAEFYNDLEIGAFEVMPALLQLKKDLLDERLSHVTLCGSGSSFFGIGRLGEERTVAGTQIFSANFINRSPTSWYLAG